MGPSGSRIPRDQLDAFLYIRSGKESVAHYGRDYQYAHDDADAVSAMDCLPEGLRGRKYYRPTTRGFEKEIKRRLDGWEDLKKRKP